MLVPRWSWLVLLGACAPEADAPDPTVVSGAFESLHARVYDVYDVPAERDAVWDLLAGSFTGRALTSEYVEHWTTRVRMTREETAIDVRRVEYDRVEVVEVAPGFARVDAAWSVGGVVTHRRHKHPRVNRYEAVYDLVETGEGWRIASTKVRNVLRVRSPSRSGGVFDVFDDTDQGGGYLDPLDLLDAGIGEDTGDTELPEDP